MNHSGTSRDYTICQPFQNNIIDPWPIWKIVFDFQIQRIGLIGIRLQVYERILYHHEADIFLHELTPALISSLLNIDRIVYEIKLSVVNCSLHSILTGGTSRDGSSYLNQSIWSHSGSRA